MSATMSSSSTDYWASNRPPSRWRVGVAAFAVAVVFYTALYVSTERYRVFSNDWVPVPDRWLLVSPDALLKMTAWLGSVTAFSFVVLRAATRRRLMLVLFVLLVPVFAVGRAGVIRQRHIYRTASCANHSGVWWWVPELGDKVSRPLPFSTEFADALAFFWAGENQIRNLHSATCPGYRLTGTKTGVVFIGGGLKLSELKDGLVLIAFCDWRCHPVPHDHLHAQIWDGESLRRECMHNKDIITAIETALAAAQAGKVPYSTAAIVEMKVQLEQRKAMGK